LQTNTEWPKTSYPFQSMSELRKGHLRRIATLLIDQQHSCGAVMAFGKFHSPSGSSSCSSPCRPCRLVHWPDCVRKTPPFQARWARGLPRRHVWCDCKVECGTILRVCGVGRGFRRHSASMHLSECFPSGFNVQGDDRLNHGLLSARLWSCLRRVCTHRPFLCCRACSTMA
jgi:hypothetical protein